MEQLAAAKAREDAKKDAGCLKTATSLIGKIEPVSELLAAVLDNPNICLVAEEVSQPAKDSRAKLLNFSGKLRQITKLAKDRDNCLPDIVEADVPALLSQAKKQAAYLTSLLAAIAKGRGV